MKTKLTVEQYQPSTEYVDGRIFFGKKGTIRTLWISGFIDPIVELIKKMGIKHIIWKANQAVPEKFAPYIKPKKVVENDNIS